MALLPLALTALRALLAPVLVLLALYFPNGTAMGVCMVLAFVSDILDGIIARRLNIATPTLRRLDSAADSVFYTAAAFAVWHLYPAEIRNNLWPLLVLVTLEIGRYAFDFAKFRREASYHMWSSKLWGIGLFGALFALLAMGQGGWPVALAVYWGIVTDVEGLAISITLHEWKSDVPSLVHALRIRALDGYNPGTSLQ